MFLLSFYLVSAEECICENDVVDYETDDYTLIWDR